MAAAGFASDRIAIERALEMRYTGQEFSLLINIPAGTLGQSIKLIAEKFHRDYAARYGHAFPEVKPEIVSVRLRVLGSFEKPELNLASVVVGERATGRDCRPVYFEGAGWTDCQVLRRPGLVAGFTTDDPALVEESQSTTVVWPGDRMHVDDNANLVISIGD
jgi:N-methylhydantoinase A/oxoprolinase/acetone carboxylase beta subunit